MSKREPQPRPPGSVKPEPPPAPPLAHKLSPVGKDCSREAAELLRTNREAARPEIEREVREECAAMVEAAGCICVALRLSVPLDSRFGCKAVWDGAGRLIEHDPRCPKALAAMLREKGKK